MLMCRACLIVEPNMMPMDDAFLKDFNLLTGLNVTFQEKTLYSCLSCYSAVNFFIEFRQKCIEADCSFQKCVADLKEISGLDCQDEEESFVKKESKFQLCHSQEFEANDAAHAEDDIPHPTENTGNEVAATRKTKKHKRLTWDPDFVPVTRLKSKTIKKLNETECKKENSVSGNIYTNTELSNMYVHTKVEPVESLLRKSERTSDKPSGKPLKCGLCSNSLQDKETLKKHLDKHDLSLPCGICLENFINIPHMLAHRVEHIPAVQKLCHICSKRFITEPTMEYHLMKFHGMTSKDEQIRCKICPRTFIDGKKLRKHIRSCHSDFKHECHVCYKKFPSKSNLIVHMDKHAKKTFECEYCAYVGNSRLNLSNHFIRKHGKNENMSCNTCNAIFRTKRGKINHICKGYAKTKDRLCTICGIHVIGNSFANHMQRHQKILYKCDKCSKAFANKYSLGYHLDRHAGTPRHACDFCPMKFYHLSALIKHRRVHTGEKPYVCEICHKGFTGNNNRKVHMRVHGIELVKKKNEVET